MSSLAEALAPIKEAIPDEAKDLRLNITSVIERCSLSSTEAAGAALAAAIMTRSIDMVEAFSNIDDLDEAEKAGVKTAASLMAMNTTWYPFVEMANDPELETVQAGLRMNAFTTHGGIDQARFELYCLAAAIVGKCHKCISSHVAELRKANYTTEQIRDIGRISASVAGVAAVLDTMATA